MPFVKKIHKMFFFASMESLTDCENPSSNPRQEACSGFPIAAFDSNSCSESRLWSWKLFRQGKLEKIDHAMSAKES
jgi:hypothetical protein